MDKKFLQRRIALAVAVCLESSGATLTKDQRADLVERLALAIMALVGDIDYSGFEADCLGPL
jgi:hypothetical protein